jgi:centrosomal protein CEP41
MKPVDFYDRKVERSTKYSHVEATLDTGLTVHKVKTITSAEYVKRRTEIFFRLTRRQLHALYDEYEQEEHESIREAAAEHKGSSSSSSGGGGGSPQRGGYKDSIVGSPKIVTYDESAQASNTKPYLILDVRDPEEYRACHLWQARSFPYSHLRRDQVPCPEYFSFRNKPETLIVVYCDDERVSRDAAKLFVDRGTDNIFLLSGGLGEFALEYPSYVEGALPAHLEPKRASGRGSGLTRSSLARIAEEEALSPSDSAPFLTSPVPKKLPSRYPASGRSSRLSERSFGDRDREGLPRAPKPRDDVSDSGHSIRSTSSVAESVISRAMSRKGKF